MPGSRDQPECGKDTSQRSGCAGHSPLTSQATRGTETRPADSPSNRSTAASTIMRPGYPQETDTNLKDSERRPKSAAPHAFKPVSGVRSVSGRGPDRATRARTGHRRTE
jgi:hypothetical protein